MFHVSPLSSCVMAFPKEADLCFIDALNNGLTHTCHTGVSQTTIIGVSHIIIGLLEKV